MTENKFYSTGRRKTSVARVYLKPGDGKIIINKKDADAYLMRETLKMIIMQPFELTGTTGQYDVSINVNGGGISGQAGAIKHGISRALLKVSDDYRKPLKKAGYLTRDAREVERKKYGQRGARARFQFSKR
ncbi:30S ribosomal protein S9 [bacterium]|nr:30S ribosomal protein S9 [bacterium]MDF1526577.1 30S ribosomal protein S9 [bacterium]MDT8366141.1 30S ribosomal protein S9 [bacterium]